MNEPTLLSRRGEPALAYAVHRPDTTNVVGAAFLTHGYAEHSGRYGEVVDAFLARGIVVATYDLRGHGRSEGHRGHVERFDQYLHDADDVLSAASKDDVFAKAGPPVLVGHSLGGLISFHVGLRDPGRFRGLVLSSPFFGLGMEVPAIKRHAGAVLSRLLPTFALPSGLKGSDLTHDLELARKYDEDPMRVKNVTSRWFTEAGAAQREAFEKAPSMTLPTLIFAAGDDRVASVEATRQLFARIGSRTKELHVLPGQMHEIWNELERAKWIALGADAVVRLASAGETRGSGSVRFDSTWG